MKHEAAGGGVSKSHFIQSVDELGNIKDEEKIDGKSAEDGKNKQKKEAESDTVREGRENFLKVFDSKRVERTDGDDEDAPDLSSGIKIHRD